MLNARFFITDSNVVISVVTGIPRIWHGHVEMMFETDAASANIIAAVQVVAEGVNPTLCPVLGVPQGSSLSALAGNILLLELDTKLNNGVTTAYRYIDDLIILGKTTEQVDKAKSLAVKWLKKQGMSLYEPQKGSDKAEAGDVKDSFTFLGCKLAPNQVEPAKKAKRSLLDKVEKEIVNAKKYLSSLFNDPTKSRQTQQGYAQTLARIDKIIYGWGYSVSFCNNRLPFKTLDSDITKLLDSFEQWFTNKTKALAAMQKRRGLGVSLLQDIENTYSQVSAEPLDYI